MGEHERGLIKKAELIIVKILNIEKITESDETNRWFRHAVKIAKVIKKDFGKIKAQHLGDSYDTIGDIKIKLPDNQVVFIETKMSDTKEGKGTKANISQDALTENGLFKGKIKSWSEFRSDNNHYGWVSKYLDSFGKYPNLISKISNLTKRIEWKARFLRDRGGKVGAQILEQISNKDREEKLDYLNYLKTQKQNSDNVKKFFILIMLGIHVQELLGRLIKRDNFFEEVENSYIYYANSYRGKIIVRKDNVKEKVDGLSRKYSEFKIIFPENRTQCKIVGLRSGKQDELLTVVFHWKNVAQGIQTPCLNIFEG